MVNIRTEKLSALIIRGKDGGGRNDFKTPTHAKHNVV